MINLFCYYLVNTKFSYILNKNYLLGLGLIGK